MRTLIELADYAGRATSLDDQAIACEAAANAFRSRSLSRPRDAVEQAASMKACDVLDTAADTIRQLMHCAQVLRGEQPESRIITNG